MEKQQEKERNIKSLEERRIMKNKDDYPKEKYDDRNIS